MIKNISIEAFDYELPAERIPQYPASERDGSKLLVWQKGIVSEQKFNSITDYFEDGNLLVFNNSRVIPARLFFEKATGAKIEIFCLEPEFPAEYSENLKSQRGCTWRCLVGNSKRWKSEILSKFLTIHTHEVTVSANRIRREETYDIIDFQWNNTNFSFAEILDVLGKIPVPPYLNRDTEDVDYERYQTIYANKKGSVAAPTAGLHFTTEILENLVQKGVNQTYVSLHVGAGTFKPVKSESIGEHDMHEEHFFVSKETLLQLIESQGKITAVGTTSVRTLESLYYIGKKIGNSQNPFLVEQWEPYETEDTISTENALQNILNYLTDNNLSEISAKTKIMIVPGYRFKIVNRLITNFHQPRSTLLLLVSAFTGGSEWKKVYDFALENDFRFLSYGDSSLLIK